MNVNLLIEKRLSNWDTSLGPRCAGYNPGESQCYLNLIIVAPIQIFVSKYLLQKKFFLTTETTCLPGN